MLPAAPARFSTMICWPRSSPRRGWRMRPTKSDAPPGANGMITRTGRLGYACPSARAGNSASTAHTSILRFIISLGLRVLRHSLERMGRFYQPGDHRPDTKRLFSGLLVPLRDMHKSWRRRALAALLALAAGGAALWGTRTRAPAPPPQVALADYVGAKACASCHAGEYQAWIDSHHRLAMQEAGDETVLGDFDGAEFRYAGITSRFFRRDGRFMVRTDGPDGRLADFEIKYAFGIWPLQQYLIEFPGGRTQALGIAWDARAKNEGGQRWVHLYPNEKIDYRDPLHWTGLYQNWNLECATCHSTNLKKGYDAASNTYKTTFSEINVACEACHGPGSRHLEWAKKNKGPYALQDTK